MPPDMDFLLKSIGIGQVLNLALADLARWLANYCLARSGRGAPICGGFLLGVTSEI